MAAIGKIVERFAPFPRHPLATHHSWRGGAIGMTNGDIVQFINGRPVRLDEALSDGDALCTLADGSHTILKWNNLRPWPTAEAEVENLP